MNVVLIVPTGIGCEIGGHAGDANPVAKLLGACCDNLILHPNVVNASDVNEMPENSWYVEGSCLDRFLRGELYLERPRQNKILVAVNKADWQSINAVSAARATIGVNAEIVELKKPLGLVAQMKNGLASGKVTNWKPLVEQVKRHEFDALGIATPITIDRATLRRYFEVGGVNPVGGVEAVASKLISSALDKPVAHGPRRLRDTGVRGDRGPPESRGNRHPEFHPLPAEGASTGRPGSARRRRAGRWASRTSMSWSVRWAALESRTKPV